MAFPESSELVFDELARRIQRRTGWRVHGLAIEIQADRAILRGRASSSVTRQLAHHIACDFCPQYLVENSIEVDNPVEFLPGIPLS